jgi:hypothetical protein
VDYTLDIEGAGKKTKKKETKGEDKGK